MINYKAILIIKLFLIGVFIISSLRLIILRITLKKRRMNQGKFPEPEENNLEFALIVIICLSIGLFVGVFINTQ
jgi:hypothetical protein